MKVNKDFKAKPLLTSVLQNSLSVLTLILAIPIEIKPRWAGQVRQWQMATKQTGPGCSNVG